MAHLTRHLFHVVRRFVREHRAEVGEFEVLTLPDGPPEFNCWQVVIRAPDGERLDFETHLDAREVKGWACAARWLLRIALASVEAPAA